MCGIFAVIHSPNAQEVVLNGLRTLEYRGYDSWGVAVIGLEKNQKDVFVEKHVGRVGTVQTYFPKTNIGIGHTRWATHGGITKENAHPHLDCTRKIAVVHNGIIENYQELKRSLKKHHVFSSETDTEVFVHLIEECAKHESFPQAVRKAFAKVQGLNAFVVLDSATRKVVAIKKGSALALGIDKTTTYIASDPVSFSQHTDKVVYIEDDEMAIVDNTVLQLFSANEYEKNIKPVHIKKQKQDMLLGKYPHYMKKEIYEQPLILKRMVHRVPHDLTQFRQEIHNHARVLLCGCGSAYYAGMAGAYFFSKLAGKQAEVVSGSEFSYVGDVLTQDSFPIFLSQSGETIDVLEAVSSFQKRMISVGAFVNAPGSSLHRKANVVFELQAGSEICVLSTKSFTAKLAGLLLLSSMLRWEVEYGKKILNTAIRQCMRVLTQAYYVQYLKPVAAYLSLQSTIFVLGRGLSYPIALETALKIKEISYIHAEGFAGGELKHGVIALIESGVPCIVFAPADETYAAIISNALEVKARGGYIIGISSKNSEVFDLYIPVGSAKEASIIPQAVVGQLLAYYIAVLLNRDIDKPRNLAKSVTVR